VSNAGPGLFQDFELVQNGLLWLAAYPLLSDADETPMIIQLEPFCLQNYSFLFEQLRSVAL
jgi:hypothetical protein